MAPNPTTIIRNVGQNPTSIISENFGTTSYNYNHKSGQDPKDYNQWKVAQNPTTIIRKLGQNPTTIISEKWLKDPTTNQKSESKSYTLIIIVVWFSYN